MFSQRITEAKNRLEENFFRSVLILLLGIHWHWFLIQMDQSQLYQQRKSFNSDQRGRKMELIMSVLLRTELDQVSRNGSRFLLPVQLWYFQIFRFFLRLRFTSWYNEALWLCLRYLFWVCNKELSVNIEVLPWGQFYFWFFVLSPSIKWHLMVRNMLIQSRRILIIVLISSSAKNQAILVPVEVSDRIKCGRCLLCINRHPTTDIPMVQGWSRNGLIQWLWDFKHKVFVNTWFFKGSRISRRKLHLSIMEFFWFWFADC